MTSATHNHLNIAKDALPLTISQYNESYCPTVAVQHCNQNLDSSESIPSEHSSIYEAPVASLETLNHASKAGQIAESSVDIVIGNNTSKALSGRPDTTHVRFSDTVGPHEARRPNTLEKTEQRSAALLGPLASPPRTSPDYPVRFPNPSQPASSSSRRRDAFSLDDLNARVSKRKQTPLHKRLCRHDSSSSSSDALEQSIPLREYRSPVHPVQPILPPPVRIPTPPGLPSFGSPEAMRYREQSRHSRGPRSSSQSSQQPPVAPSHNAGAGNNGSGVPPSRGGSLRRFFLSWAEPQPAPLAPGVVGRAEDGTLVRARFGTRQSGHGIGAGPGSRGLEAHPFHRRTLPVARTNEVVQIDGSPHGSPDEGQLSRPEAFAPPRTVRASSSSSHSALPFSNATHVPQLRFPSNINPRISSHAGSTTAGPSHFTFRESELRLPRINEMTASPRADNHTHTPSGQGQGTQEPNSSPFQTNSKTAESYWTQFRELWSLFCCGTGNDEREATQEGRPRQVDGGGDVPGNPGRVPNGSPAIGRGAGLGSRPLAQNSVNSPWIPAWGCQPGRTMGGDGASEDG